MKILRFDNDRVGVLKNGDTFVDVTDVVEGGAFRGPQGVMEELIGNFDVYRHSSRAWRIQRRACRWTA